MTNQLQKQDLPTWHIVLARPSHELRAAEEMISLGQTVYVPRFRKEFQHRRNKGWSIRYFSLLSGYIFVLGSEHWGRVLGCESVSHVLRNSGGVPFSIEDDVVRAIRQAQDAGVYDEMRVHGRVPVNSEVKVLDGALAGIKGHVAASDDAKVVFMLEMFGRQVKARAPLEILGKVG